MVFLFALIFGVTVGWLWLTTGKHVPILSAGAAALVLASAVQGVLGWRWWRLLPARDLDAAMRQLRHDGIVPDGAVVGRVIAVPHDPLPAILWRSKLEGRAARHVSHHASVVTSQPFVVRTESETWLIDTPFVEVAGGSDVDDTFGKQCRVGDSVFLYPAEGVDELAPPWAVVVSGGAGYRSTRVTRMLASAETPVRILVHASELKGDGGRLRVDALATASRAEDVALGPEESGLEHTEEKRAEID